MLRVLPILLALATLGHAEPGLILRFGETDARIARQIALFVPSGQAASAYSAPGQIKATWEGSLHLEARSRLIFTFEGNGKAKLSIDDELLAEEFGVPSERKRLSSGEHSIKVEYTGPATGAAQLRLFWEGRDFGKEPVPASVFTHDPADAQLTTQTQKRHGHQLISERHCTSCHGDAGNAGAPSLAAARTRLQTSWLGSWIANPKSHRHSARMPKLLDGEDAIKKASDIAQYLVPSGMIPGDVFHSSPKAIKDGGLLFYEQGCIGCHTLDVKGDSDRIGLGAIDQKYRPYALARFLREPGKHHPDTRMPQFGFDEVESEALEAYLRSLDKAGQTFSTIGDPKRGELLFQQVGCINCHPGVGDLKSTLPAPKPLADLNSADCKAAEFSLSEAEQNAITAALAAPEPSYVPAEFAQHQFTNLRCAACHERDARPASRDRFADEIAHLKPPEPAADEIKAGAHKAQIPALNHLGLKLRPEWRTQLLNGEIAPKTRHWLHARMPAFKSRAKELSAGFSHAVGLPAVSSGQHTPDPAMVKAGAELTGLTGLSCGACHAIGDKPAFAVFEGEGPNFSDAGARLNAEYFHLWMNDPARQWLGTIMPKYATDGQTPLTQHYDGDATKQFEAIRHYLNSLSK